MSPISRPARSAGPFGASDEISRPVSSSLAGVGRGTGWAPMPSHGRATWPLASNASTTRVTVKAGTTMP